MENNHEDILHFFVERVKSTFALNENQKNQLILQANILSIEEMDKILSIIVNYESLIIRDSNNTEEEADRKKELDSMETVFNAFTL